MPSPDLPRSKRIPAAKLSGAVSRLTRGDQKSLSRPEKLAALQAITTDPQTLGHVLGALLAPEHDDYRREDEEAVGLLRELGADEGEAQKVAAWQRQRLDERRTRSGFREPEGP